MPPATFLQNADNLFDISRKTREALKGDKVDETITLLLHIVDNILAQPSNPKRRRIRLENPKFDLAVGECPEAMQFLKALGFSTYPSKYPQFIACPVVYISRFTDAHYALGGTKATLPNTPGVFNPFVSSIKASGQVASAPRLTEKGLAEKEAFSKELEHQKHLLKTGGTKPGTMELNPKVFRQGSSSSNGMPRIEDVVKELNSRSELLDEADDFELIKAQLSSIKDSLTSADRAFQSREKKEMEKLKNRTIHTVCVIRVAFPDRLVLQLQFRPSDTISSLYDAVQQFLNEEYKDKDWYLYQTPPMRKLQRNSKRMVADEDLVPSALIRWGYEGISASGTAITEQGPFLDANMVPPPEPEGDATAVKSEEDGVTEEDRKRYRKERTKKLLAKFKSNKKQSSEDHSVEGGGGGKDVSVIGATGAVGKCMIQCLAVLNIPIKKLSLYASSRSAGTSAPTPWGDIPIEEFSVNKLVEGGSGCRVALLAVSGTFAQEVAPKLADAGIVVVDNSSAFRYDDNVPLVIPEINPQAMNGEHMMLIANPNCTTAIAAMVLWPLHQAFHIKRIIMSTYQAASGAGDIGLDELESQMQDYGQRPLKSGKAFPHQLLGNVIPRIDALQSNGYTKEEMKVAWETRKIFNDTSLLISCTAVRVPTMRAHAEAISVEFESSVNIDKVTCVLKESPMVIVEDDPVNDVYPTSLGCTGKIDVSVGRIRQSLAFPDQTGVDLFVCGDQLLRGAALNAVLIVKELGRQRGWF
ncbi:hypothetical protein FOL47_005907 [Perkinsus chesapeaki]|uniref:UBX domain-containing protein n=1 Tax=Perkinsus chesapeaki TaxID=330153 RepID=A0A7J6LUX5_PERCH|nr:hypothetical protein FOL47_005907 [Perkinsus chesapeaki]